MDFEYVNNIYYDKTFSNSQHLKWENYVTMRSLAVRGVSETQLFYELQVKGWL